MASPHASIRHVMSPLFSTFRSLTLSSSSTLTKSLLSLTTLLRSTSPILPSTTRNFHTTPSPQTDDRAHPGRARPSSSGTKSKRIKTDPRITLIRYHMQHPRTPRPLHLSRMRALRHWTIHRAWMLNRRKKLEREEEELYRQYQAMQSACEELRLMDEPGTKDSGRLFRIAMEKKGIFGMGGVPIEYARFQVETPAKEAWNHGWTR